MEVMIRNNATNFTFFPPFISTFHLTSHFKSIGDHHHHLLKISSSAHHKLEPSRVCPRVCAIAIDGMAHYQMSRAPIAACITAPSSLSHSSSIAMKPRCPAHTHTHTHTHTRPIWTAWWAMFSIRSVPGARRLLIESDSAAIGRGRHALPGFAPTHTHTHTHTPSTRRMIRLLWCFYRPPAQKRARPNASALTHNRLN